MSHNDNIKIKFSGNDFFYVNAVMPGGEATPTDARCAGLLSDTNLTPEKCVQYTEPFTYQILWRAFDETTEKTKLDSHNVGGVDKGILKIGTFNNMTFTEKYTNGSTQNTSDGTGKIASLVINNNNLQFISNTSPSNTFFDIDISNINDSDIYDDFTDEINEITTKVNTYNSSLTSFKERTNYLDNQLQILGNYKNIVNTDINISLYTSNKKFKLGFTEEGNLVLMYKKKVNNYWIDLSGDCYKKEVCQNKEKALKLNDLENNHSGRDQNFINSQNIYSLELRRSIALSLGLIILFGSIIYNKK